MPFIGLVFLGYTIGGQRLLQKYFPFVAESEKKKASDSESKG